MRADSIVFAMFSKEAKAGLKPGVRKWVEAPEINLPIKCDRVNFTVDKLDLTCPICNQDVPRETFRGYVNEWGHPKDSERCMDIEFWGQCKPCKNVAHGRIRYYPANRRWLTLTNQGWMVSYSQVKWAETIMSKIRRAWTCLSNGIAAALGFSKKTPKDGN